jgi:hypothetical protein
MGRAVVKQSELSTDTSGMLSELIAFDADGRAVWPAQELQNALRQHLHSRVGSDGSGLINHYEQQLQRIEDLASAAAPPVQTISDLLHHLQPPVELLTLIKDIAKLRRNDASSPLPPEIWVVVYYGCITVAMVRCGRHITRLALEDLRQGLNWATRQPWLDDDTRQLLLEGLRHLRSPRMEWRT